MVRTVIFFIIFWLYQICIFPILLLLGGGQLLGHRHAVRRIAGRVAWTWSKVLMGVAGARLTRRGEVHLPPDQPALYVSNHQGAFDIPLALLSIKRPVGFFSKIELARVPSIGSWMKLMGCIFVERGNTASALQSLDEAVQALRDGVSLVIFPEGTRSGSEKMKHFKTGFARMAIRAEVPIVPMVMKGTYRLKQKDAPWIAPAEVEVAIEPPISTQGLAESDSRELKQRVQDVIQARLEAIDDPQAEAPTSAAHSS